MMTDEHVAALVVSLWILIVILGVFGGLSWIVWSLLG